MTGFICVPRGWMDACPSVEKEPFDSRSAWMWLYEQAAWKPIKVRTNPRSATSLVSLERGQLSFSIRFMAEAWGWHKNRVHRFIHGLAANGVIRVENGSIPSENSGTGRGTETGQSAGQSQLIITICNYGDIHNADDALGTGAGTGAGTATGTLYKKKKKEEGKKVEEGRVVESVEEKIPTHTEPLAHLRVVHDADLIGDNAPAEPEPRSARYRFEGKFIKLNTADFEKWRQTYHTILDLEAELDRIDGSFVDDPPKNGPDGKPKWWGVTKAKLNHKHAANLKEEKVEKERRSTWQVGIG